RAADAAGGRAPARADRRGAPPPRSHRPHLRGRGARSGRRARALRGRPGDELRRAATPGRGRRDPPAPGARARRPADRPRRPVGRDRRDPRTLRSDGEIMDVPRKKKSKLPRYIAWAVAAAVALGGATLGLSRLRAAPPSVEWGTVWPDTVKRGTMIRQ